MTLRNGLMITGLGLLAACVTQSPASTDPDAAKYDDYYSEKSGGGADGGSGDSGSTFDTSVKTVTSSKGVSKKKGKGKALIAKRPPVKGGKKKKKNKKKKKKKTGGATRPTPPDTPTIDGVMPTVAIAGSVVEVFGSNLDQANLQVLIGNRKQKVIEATPDKLVVEISGKPTNATLGLGKGVRKKGKRRGGKKQVRVTSSESKFVILKDDGMLGRPRTNVEAGVLGNVFSLPDGATELPAFGDLGAAVHTVAYDTIDIAPGEFTQGLGDITGGFAVHFRGSLNITEEADYNLCLNAGDGAQLYLDENVIVDNDGAHETTEVCEELFIEPGEYQLDLLWFQAAAGELGLQLTWQINGGEKEPIPTANLFPPTDAADTMSRP